LRVCGFDSADLFGRLSVITDRMAIKNAGVTFAVALILSLSTNTSMFGADAQTTVVRQPVAVDASRLSGDLLSLAKLVQSGVDDKVIVTFIQNTPPKRNPSAEELVYLHELGLSSEAMVTLMNAVPKVSLAEPEPTAPATTVASAPQTPAQNAPVAGNTVISSPAPTVVYTQPAASTVYVQPPPVVTYVEPVRPRVTFSFGFGHFFGHHHHHGGHYRHHGHWRGHH